MTPGEIAAHQARVRGEPPAAVAKARRARERSPHEVALERQLRMSDRIPQDFETERYLVPGRRFRTDFLWRPLRVALEVNGTRWDGRTDHQSTDGMTSDATKALRLAALGWVPLMVTAPLIASGEALELLERVFAARTER